MTRITLILEQSLLRQLEKLAEAEGSSLHDVANRLLRLALTNRDRRPYKLSLHGWDAMLQPGVDLLDRNALFDE